MVLVIGMNSTRSEMLRDLGGRVSKDDMRSSEKVNLWKRGVGGRNWNESFTSLYFVHKQIV